jgi:hypothetical protein
MNGSKAEGIQWKFGGERFVTHVRRSKNSLIFQCRQRTYQAQAAGLFVIGVGECYRRFWWKQV